MSFSTHIKYYFLKYPLFRVLILVGGIALITAIIAFTVVQDKLPPIVIEINPAVGESGDVMTIRGENFGTKEISNYVEIGGSRLTSSAYLSWDDTAIKILLPYNVPDGLVYVETQAGRSEPSIFANRQTIPVPIQHNPQTTIPKIDSILNGARAIGNIITIKGNNFNTLRGSSQVLFTAFQDENTSDNKLIPGSEFDMDYQLWSNTELHVRIPDGAISGQVFVKTQQGKSNGYNVNLAANSKLKTYTNSLTYLVTINADISNAEAEPHATLTLFMPLPPQSATQGSVEIVSSKPKATITNYLNTLVHQVKLTEATDAKLTFSHDFMLDVQGVKTNITSRQVPQYSQTVLTLYHEYLQADDLVPSDDDALIALIRDIVKNEQNPWLKAKLLYDWIIENITVLSILRSADAPVLKVLTTKTGDSYDMAVLYTAFLRAAGIPAITSSGILVDSDLKSVNHWWTEFYIEGIGWIPADTALGAGLPYKAFQKIEVPSEFYFGNLDAQHITFSRGWNNINQTNIMGEKVYFSKSYALQSIWEESTAGTIGYSSYWSNAIVVGMY